MSNFKTGIVNEFNDITNPLTQAEIDSLPKHRADCMDCHNRPAHRYADPDVAMNVRMALGQIDPSLPSVKKVGLELLSADYETADEAVAKIAEGVRAYYREGHPEVFAARQADVNAAIYHLEAIYRHNFFPRMRVRWDTYPDHSGHLTSPGCFRCHDGNHASAAGDVVTNDCRTCHVILAQGTAGALRQSSDEVGLDFEHPGDVGDTWQGMAIPRRQFSSLAPMLLPTDR